jgi:hypothetical protein
VSLPLLQLSQQLRPPSGSPGDVQPFRDSDEERGLSYCVFCGICYDAGAPLEAAHLVPNAVSERFTLEVSEHLLARIGGYYRTTLNAVAACIRTAGVRSCIFARVVDRRSAALVPP